MHNKKRFRNDILLVTVIVVLAAIGFLIFKITLFNVFVFLVSNIFLLIKMFFYFLKQIFLKITEFIDIFIRKIVKKLDFFKKAANSLKKCLKKKVLTCIV